MRKVFHIVFFAAFTLCVDSSLAAPINGAFLHLGYAKNAPSMTRDELQKQFAEFKEIGIEKVIAGPVQVRNPLNDCNSKNYEWVEPMPDAKFLADLAQQHSMKIRFGLFFEGGCISKWTDPQFIQENAAHNGAIAKDIAALVGTHPAFDGFYVMPEPSLGFPGLESHYPFFKAMADAIRPHAGTKNIAVSPMMGNQPMSASQMAAKAKAFFDNNGMYQIWQDSAGSYAYNLETKGSRDFKAYYRAIAAAVGLQNMAGNVEIFNGPTTNFTGVSYRPTSIERLAQQITGVREITSQVYSWLPQFHMGSVDRHRYPEADRLLRTYKAWAGISGSQIQIASYEYATPPANNYPDKGGALTNKLTGDPLKFTDKEWVGVDGKATIVFTLPGKQKVDWVYAHMLQEPGPSIFIPASMAIYCSDDKAAWKHVRTVARPFSDTTSPSEYVMGTDQPLAMQCAYVKLEFANSSWTFLSEIGMTSDAASVAVVPPANPVPPPANPPPNMEPVPNVLLAIAGWKATGASSGQPNHGVVKVLPTSNYPKVPIGFGATGKLQPGDACKLQVFPKQSWHDGVVTIVNNSDWFQFEMPSPGAGVQSTVCAYCYGYRNGAYTQYSVCGQINH